MSDVVSELGGGNGKHPTGAVLVIGGGIAGMQASLDLADQGFKVYLAETKTAIGGKMAQLDKTFPTNDCAMCTISPKLVDVGRHPNIEVLTRADVLQITGTVGHFKARVKIQPRYVDVTKCVACGDCEKVCPVVVPNSFNEGLNQRRAIYKLYPQAVPNAYAIEKRGIAPCRDACPAGQRAQGYIALIREGRWEDALEVIKLDNPFPGICGRICNHRCESACNRGLVDEPINIRALKRFVTDKVYSKPREPVEPAKITHNQKVAIIGAGPCGLTAAKDLVLAGYPVTVFEAMPVAGGMLRLGVPEYRLPTEIIEREVQDIVDLGVDLRLNHKVENLDNIFSEGYDAVLIAVGAHEGVRLPIPGANLDGVLINTQFLRDVRLGKYQKPGSDAPPLGNKVLVLGGGNVAIDCARTAIRLGKEVHLACLESREEMPAHPWEIEAAIEEGVVLHPGRTFEQIIGDDHGHVRGVECMLVKQFSFDENGRLHVEKVPDTEHFIPCDTVIFSVGQRAGLAFIPDDAGVGITNRQTIAINPNTLAATREGVFAAGDSVSGTAFVIEAVASGHRAAESIMRYLENKPLEPEPKPALPVVHLTESEIEARIARGELHRKPRVPMPELPPSERKTSFVEVERGYDERSAQEEAERCLACGICSECMRCVEACGTGAINHEMVAEELEIEIGGIVLAPGYAVYNAELSEEYGFGRYPNVITSLQFERLLSASGPTMGHVKRPSDGSTPTRIAFLQCVGSRDQTHDYCSAVCCMYATKEATIAKEHYPEMDIHIFLMDMRAFSKGYFEYYQRATQRYGVQVHRSRVSMLKEDPKTHNLIVTYVDEGGQPLEEHFDLVVLSVGMEISEDVKALGRRLGIELDSYGFCHTVKFNPIETSRAGIYAVGPFREPKDIPESVTEASGAAAAIASQLSPSRFTLTTQKVYPPERDVSGEPPRVGVFVCHCGSNIAGYLDVEEVTRYAQSLPGVVIAKSNLYTCSQDSIRHITEMVKEHQLNRVVVASCTPLTHQSLFQDSIRMAGLNPYLFEMANIRNQCSWVHSNDKTVATEKAKLLVRMAVARALKLTPQHEVTLPVQQTALVVGGGIAGMTTALTIADSGYGVHLVEREDVLGGQLRHVYVPLDGTDPGQVLNELISKTRVHPNITIYLNSEVVKTEGAKGNFTTLVRSREGKEFVIKHGATVLATGAEEYRGDDYLLNQSNSVITNLQFEQMLRIKEDLPSSVAMIFCVGPAEAHCGRVCCTLGLKNAVALREMNPESQVVIFYKDIRTYAFYERLYKKARELGVIFLRYDEATKPSVELGKGGELKITGWDKVLGRQIQLQPEYLVLSMPMVPPADVHKVANLFKASIGEDGYYLEAHVKLRPVDFSTEGVFMAGSGHYPKLVSESMIQAQAAASRAMRVLSQKSMQGGGQVAVVEETKCTGCLTCVRVCPFGVPRIDSERIGVGQVVGAAHIDVSICQGCGTCVAECPAQAIQLMHYTDVQLFAKTDALFDEIDLKA